MTGAAAPSNTAAREVVVGCVYVTLAAICFSAMLTFIRLATAEVHPFQAAFFRFAFGALFMLPYILRHSGPGTGNVWRTNNLRLHLGRTIFTVSATLTWFSALTVLPVAEAVSLNFTTPMFATIGAALILGEVVRVRRWAATMVGFIGVLVIVRPGFTEVSWPMVLPILAAVFMAGAVMFIKRLSKTDSAATMVNYQNLLPLPAFFVIALFFWTTPSWNALFYMALTGALGNLAHICLSRGFARADASLVMPFDYTRLPFAAAIAFLVFGEVPSIWTWVGAAVIAGAAVYIARREAQLAAQGRHDPTPPPPLDPKMPA